MNGLSSLPRLVAAALFAGSASAAVFVGDAMHAGQPNQGLLASAPLPADAGVIVRVGPNRYHRYAYRGGRWLYVGLGYAAAPGYFGGYYLGYGPPVVAYYPPYYGPRYYPAYYGRPYRHPFYWHGYYRRGYYGHVSYGWRR